MVTARLRGLFHSLYAAFGMNRAQALQAQRGGAAGPAWWLLGGDFAQRWRYYALILHGICVLTR